VRAASGELIRYRGTQCARLIPRRNQVRRHELRDDYRLQPFEDRTRRMLQHVRGEGHARNCAVGSS
jgi:hypothetical protein